MKDQDVYQVIMNDERFTILADILKISGIGEVLANESGVFTFFAPTDTALRTLPSAVLDLLRSSHGNRLAATTLGRYIVPGLYLYSDDLRQLTTVEPLSGRTVKINTHNNALRFGRSPIRTPGIAARNGVVFPIDGISIKHDGRVGGTRSSGR